MVDELTNVAATAPSLLTMTLNVIRDRVLRLPWVLSANHPSNSNPAHDERLHRPQATVLPPIATFRHTASLLSHHTAVLPLTETFVIATAKWLCNENASSRSKMSVSVSA